MILFHRMNKWINTWKKYEKCAKCQIWKVNWATFLYNLKIQTYKEMTAPAHEKWKSRLILFEFLKFLVTCIQSIINTQIISNLGQQGDQTSPYKENQHWIFTGRTDTETKAPILWLHDMKSWLIRKDHGAGKDWSQEEKGMTEDEMVG